VNRTIRTPAKVNLCLLVGPKDETGYHEVFTVFAPIDLYDELEFSLEAQAALGTSGALQVDCITATGEKNLATQALRALGAQRSGGHSQAYSVRSRSGRR